MKGLLLILLTSALLRQLESIRAVVWDKGKNTFVSIFDIPEFESERVRVEAKCYEEAHHDFQGQIFKLMYFQEDNIFEYYANDTIITGMFGDIWTTLSKSLNFTIISLKEEIKTIGYAFNTTFFVGGMGNISRKEIDIIPLSVMNPRATAAMDFIQPIWHSGYYLYADWQPKHDKFWIIKVFSCQVWCAVGAMHVLLTICSFFTEQYTGDDKKMKSTIGEHCFYNFAALCNQNSVPDSFNRGSTVFRVTRGFYCLLLYTSFSALLYSHLTYRVPDPPFVNLRTFIDNSDYHVAVVEGSTPHNWFKFNVSDEFIEIAEKGRLKVVKTLFDVSDLVCDDSNRKTKYATILNEVEKKTMRSRKCNPDQLGITIYKAWVASSVRKNFPYKESIETLLLKMQETGVIDILNERWIEWRHFKKSECRVTDAIAFDQIFLPLCFYVSGAGISILIVFLEICVYYSFIEHRRHH